jgi:hypothetical protein
MTSRPHRGLALLAALFCGAGCSVGALRTNAPPAIPIIVQEAVEPASTAGPFLYVAGGKVSMYALQSSEPLHSISGYGGTRIALDRHGDLCESNGNPSYQQIFEFNARTLKLKRTLDGQGWFQALVSDRSGYLYASTGGNLFVYAPGCTLSVSSIGGCASGALPLVFDQSGNLYAGNYHAVCIYAPTKKPGEMKFVRAIRQGVNGPIALAIGPSGELFVANANDSSISLIASGGSKPTRRITKGLDFPWNLAVDSKGRLYVGNRPYSPPLSPGWVSVYASGGMRPIREVMYGKAVAPTSLAIDPSDNLYVAVNNRVDVYSPGAVKLLRRITKGVLAPYALLIGSP